MASGCRTGPPAYVAWRAGTTTQRYSRLLHSPGQELRIRLQENYGNILEVPKTFFVAVISFYAVFKYRHFLGHGRLPSRLAFFSIPGIYFKPHKTHCNLSMKMF
jgi:hypothetical protein